MKQKKNKKKEEAASSRDVRLSVEFFNPAEPSWYSCHTRSMLGSGEGDTAKKCYRQQNKEMLKCWLNDSKTGSSEGRP